MNSSIQVKSYQGKQVVPLIDDLASFRIEGFRSFPYLYDGNIAYEKKYLAAYEKTPEALLLCAWDQDKLIGMATSLPLTADSDIIEEAPELFRTHGLNPDEYYYFAEIIVSPNYRGAGIGNEMYRQRKEHARSLGLSRFCLAVVERPQNHPLRPAGYQDPQYVWAKDGFTKTEMTFTFEWPTYVSNETSENQTNQMRFWIKD